MTQTVLAYLDASDINAVWDLHCDQMNAFGFDRMIYGMTRFRSGMSVGAPEDFLILTNHAQPYAEALFQNARYLRGPMAQWALTHVGCQSWRYAQDRARAGLLTPGERELMELNASMGVVAGYTISFECPSDRQAAAISLVARAGLSQDEVDAIWDQHGIEIQMLNKLLHLKCGTLPHETSRPLTRRQKEVLDWIGDGKSVADVGVLLGVSPATVEKHLRLARAALQAETTAQAILKHAFQNQVFVDETIH